MKKSLVLAVLALSILVLVGASSAFADTYSVYAGQNGTAKTATDTVTVSATINPKLVLQVVTPDNGQAVNFGSVDPGSTSTKPVTLTIWSNKGYTISETQTGAAAIGLTTVNTIPGSYSKSANDSGQVFSDSYKIQVPWNTDPNSYTATVLYTVLQS